MIVATHKLTSEQHAECVRILSVQMPHIEIFWNDWSSVAASARGEVEDTPSLCHCSEACDRLSCELGAMCVECPSSCRWGTLCRNQKVQAS